MPQNVITMAKSNDPTKFVRTKTKLRKKISGCYKSEPGAECSRGGGGGAGRRTLIVLISFPFFSNSINYLAFDPKLNWNRHFSPFVKHVSSYTNSFAESKHNLKEKSPRDHLEGFPEIGNGEQSLWFDIPSSQLEHYFSPPDPKSQYYLDISLWH